MTKKITDSNWISFSDIMTGLMVIFMFIAISYIVEVQKRQNKRNEIFEEFKRTKDTLYVELMKEFNDDFQKWQVELDKDLSIKFTNPEVLFASGETDINSYFQQILNDFLPRYFEIILKPKYKDKIAEIRIEGHTDTVPAPKFDKDPYIGNIILSQLRSTQVIKHLRSLEYYNNLSQEDEYLLQFWITSNGLSFGRTLDDNKKLTFYSNQRINNKFSRRVEFRIITTSEKLVEKVITELNDEPL
jgi:outer membrane protein OmpA-like peptidoglycan-associated protein